MERANVRRTITVDQGKAAVELLNRWRAHENDRNSAVTTLWAVFGVVSPLGRFADKFSFLNPPYEMWLEDIAYDCEIDPPRLDAHLDTHPRSPAAAEMIEHGLVSDGRGRRRLAMTAAASAALRRYYQEKLGLLAEIGRLVTSEARKRNHVARHLQACRIALERLSSCPKF